MRLSSTTPRSPRNTFSTFNY